MCAKERGLSGDCAFKTAETGIAKARRFLENVHFYIDLGRFGL